MKQLKRFVAVLVFLFLTPVLEAMPKKTPKTALAASVEYHGSPLDLAGSNNFRVVIPDHIYRANTLKPEVLSYYITKHGLNGVICLRGEHPEKEWWQKEAYVCERQNVALHSLALRANSYIQPEQLDELLTFFDQVNGPVLLHCLSGVDRTGLAVGLWLLEMGGASRKKATHQLSFFRFGHRAYKYPQMKSCLKLWAALRDRFDSVYALQEYKANYNNMKLADVAKLKSGNKKLKFALGYVEQVVYNLEMGRYMPRTKPPRAPEPNMPSTSKPIPQVRL